MRSAITVGIRALATVLMVGCTMTISAQPSAGHVAFGQDENAARFEVVNPILSADRRSTVGVVAVLTQAV